MLSKRAFDILLSFILLVAFLPLIGIAWVIAAFETHGNGFFIQTRIGKDGRPIRVCKIKTMYPAQSSCSPIASNKVHRITRSGKIFRKCKLDELPQLFNVLAWDMSLVGPRPDVAGYADRLEGADRVILLLRPGITGPASIKYRNEESILAGVDDPVSYNDTVIWPDKVRINRAYVENRSLLLDIKYIVQTIFK